MKVKGVFIIVSNKNTHKRKGPHGKHGKDVIAKNYDATVNTMFISFRTLSMTEYCKNLLNKRKNE